VLALLTASCGSSGSSGSTSRSGTTSATTSGTTKQTIGADAFDRFPKVAPAVAAKLPAAPTNTAERAYLIALFDDAQKVWLAEFRAAHLPYHAALLFVFTGETHSSCGKTGEGSGPFYCPGDDGVYLDIKFFAQLLNNKHVGAAADAYIIGHEIAHHIQRLVGIARRVDAAVQADPSRKNALSVKVELQADCLAGVWARSAYPRSGLDANALYEGLKTAHVIGDDYLTHAAGNIVDTALFTHGSSEARKYWLRTGYRSGRPNACDTFAGG
jgi:uncharacterized protein